MKNIKRETLDNCDAAILVTGINKQDHLDSFVQLQGTAHDLAVMVCSVVIEIRRLGLGELLDTYLQQKVEITEEHSSLMPPSNMEVM